MFAPTPIFLFIIDVVIYYVRLLDYMITKKSLHHDRHDSRDFLAHNAPESFGGQRADTVGSLQLSLQPYMDLSDRDSGREGLAEDKKEAFWKGKGKGRKWKG